MKNTIITIMAIFCFVNSATANQNRGNVFNEYTYIEHITEKYGKDNVISYILSKREGKITIETDDYIGTYNGRPGKDYVNTNTILKDIRKMNSDVLAFADGVKEKANEQVKYVKIGGQWFKKRSNTTLKIRSGGYADIDEDIANSGSGPATVATFNGDSKEAEAFLKNKIPEMENIINKFKMSSKRVLTMDISSRYSGELDLKNQFDNYVYMTRLLNSRLGKCEDQTLITKVQELRAYYAQFNGTLSMLVSKRITYLIKKNNPGKDRKELILITAREQNAGYPTIGKPWSSSWR